MHRPFVWRRLLLLLCALAACVLAYDTYVFARVDAPNGASDSPTTQAFQRRITFVRPGGNAAEAGLRTGDLYTYRDLSAPDRYRWRFNSVRGPKIALHIERAGQARDIVVPMNHRNSGLRWDVWLALAGSAWLLAFAAVIAWRRADDRSARILALLLILATLGIGLQSNNFVSESTGLNLVVWSLAALINAFSVALLATFVSQFGHPLSAARRTLFWLSYISAAGVAAITIASLVGLGTLLADPDGPLLNGAIAYLIGALEFGFPIIAGIATLLSTRGAVRSRCAWALASLSPIYLVAMVINGIQMWDPAYNPHLLGTISNLTLFVAPIGLTYSLFKGRLLDIGFAVNRAAVFTGVSLIVVGAFVLVEWILGEWLHTANHTTNVAVSGGLALALGLSIRAIHSRVDHFVDNVFFRKRHEDEKALRRFAHEAAYMSAAEPLLQRTRALLETHADASAVTIRLEDANGHWPGIDDDDPALLEMRAWHHVVDLQKVHSVISGEFAFPMMARGRLVGFISLGPKRSGEAYAPDEIDAIAELAHGVGTSLDVLNSRGADSSSAMLEAISGLTDTVRDLPKHIIDNLRATLGQQQ